MSKHQLGLADRQCRMSELRSGCKTLVISFARPLRGAAERRSRSAGGRHRLPGPTRKLTGKRPSDRYYRRVTKLGESDRRWRLQKHRRAHPDEIMMLYDK